MMEKGVVMSMKPSQSVQAIAPDNDLWDPIRSLHQTGKHVLTSVEFTMTHLCNMRCEHCAVGDTLSLREGTRLPLRQIFQRLDEIEHLQTISITGGEPSLHMRTINEYILPLLKYAKDRGLQTQMNSNLTLDLERYMLFLPWLDVMHISFNYTGADDFHYIGFANAARPTSQTLSRQMYERMISNAKSLSEAGMFISAESMINYRTFEHIVEIHNHVISMGCQRHEIHPMYPSAFASNLPVLSLPQTRSAIAQLLMQRDPEVWMLFGTLPFYHCSPDPQDRKLLEQIESAPRTTIRNDPDGRNRLNVNLFSGEVFITDFAELSSFGHIQNERLEDIFKRWLEHPLMQTVNCHCPAVGCCGPNLLVKDAYYRDVDFTSRKAILPKKMPPF